MSKIENNDDTDYSIVNILNQFLQKNRNIIITLLVSTLTGVISYFLTGFLNKENLVLVKQSFKLEFKDEAIFKMEDSWPRSFYKINSNEMLKLIEQKINKIEEIQSEIINEFTNPNGDSLNYINQYGLPITFREWINEIKKSNDLFIKKTLSQTVGAKNENPYIFKFMIYNEGKTSSVLKKEAILNMGKLQLKLTSFKDQSRDDDNFDRINRFWPKEEYITEYDDYSILGDKKYTQLTLHIDPKNNPSQLIKDATASLKNCNQAIEISLIDIYGNIIKKFDAIQIKPVEEEISFETIKLKIDMLKKANEAIISNSNIPLKAKNAGVKQSQK